MENQELIKQVTEKAEKWLTPAYDAETQAEVKRMLENPDKTEVIDSFYKDLEFGTGGLRGIMGAGTNRMNIYTVGAATQGLSNYLNKCFAGKKDISFTVDGNDLDDAVAALEANQARLGYAELHSERNIAKLSIVGAGMMSNPGVAAKMFESLYNEGVNINMISTSEIRVTVLINEKDGVRAMNAVHDAFNLAD